MLISVIAAAGAAALTFNILDCVENKISAKIAAQQEPVEEPAPAPAYVEPVQAPFQAPSNEPEQNPAEDPKIGEQIASAIASVQDAIVNISEDDDTDDPDEEDDNEEETEAPPSSGFVVGDTVTVSNPVTVKGTRFGGNPETKYKITGIDFDTGYFKISKGPKKRTFEVDPAQAGLKKI